MLIYFDESYKPGKRLSLGALFLPTVNKRKILHKKFAELKKDIGFLTQNGKLKEIKYSEIFSKKRLDLAKEAIRLFVGIDNAYFRACTMPYDVQKITKIGQQSGIPRKLKEAIIYTKSTVQLLKNNLPGIKNATLLMDNVTRARGDKFDVLIRQKLGKDGNSTFRHIGYVDSKAERNHTIQICDLLLGVITNEHFPTKSKSGRFKNDFREFVKKELKLSSLKNQSCWKKSQKQIEKLHPKYTVRFWRPSYK